MGLVLDSSVIVAAERRAQPISNLLRQIRGDLGVGEVLLSTVSVIELEHGYWRAGATQFAGQRRAYLDSVYAAIPVQPFTKEMAQLAGKIDAEA